MDTELALLVWYGSQHRLFFCLCVYVGDERTLKIGCVRKPGFTLKKEKDFSSPSAPPPSDDFLDRVCCGC